MTYNGWPLYTWAEDMAPGQATGEGLNNLGGLWYVLDTTGSAIKRAPASAARSAAEACGLLRAPGRVAGAVGVAPAPASLPPSTMRYSSRIGLPVEEALEDLAGPGRVPGLCGERGSRDVRRHPVVGHRPPRVVGRRPAAGTRRRPRTRRAVRTRGP